MKTTFRLIKLLILPIGFLSMLCAFGTWIPLQPDGSIKITGHLTEVQKMLNNPELWVEERSPASVKPFPHLTYEQLKKADSKAVYNYYMSVYKFMIEMERFGYLKMNGKLKSSHKNAFLFKLIQEAHAQDLSNYHLGGKCYIGGGYQGQWRTRPSDGRTSCDSGLRCQLPGDSGGRRSGHPCNPKFFTYSNAKTLEPFCVSITDDLTQSCLNKLVQMAGPKGEEQFIQHLHRGHLEYAQTQAQYQGKSENQILSEIYADVNRQYQPIREYCGETAAQWSAHKWGQQHSCFKLLKYYQQAYQYREIAQVPQPPQPLSPPPQYHGGGNIEFGPFACVRNGMSGYADDRYLAMHATMIRDNYIGKQMTAKNVAYMKRDMIRRIRDMGYCKPGYHNGPMSPNVGGWINGTAPLSKRAGLFGLFGRKIQPHYEVEFQQTFGVSYKQMRNMENLYRNTGKFEYRDMKRTPMIGGRCVRLSNRRLETCRNLARACRIEDNFCGESPKRFEGGEGPGGNGPGNGNNGNGNNGNTGNNGTGTNGPGGEVGGGSNDGAGHGADGGGGQGAGPGGVSQ